MRLAIRLVASLAACAALTTACGSRGPLDDGPIFVVVEAGTEAVDAGEPEAGPVDASVDAREAGVVQCGSCLLNQCAPNVLKCVTDTKCRTVLQCVVQTCTGGSGGLDFGCAAKCASSDPGAALQIFQIFQCVTDDCGPECGSLLGGLLGGLGGLGGGGGGGGKGGGGGGKMTPIEEAFSVFPQMCTPPR